MWTKECQKHGCHWTGWSEEDSLKNVAQGKPCDTLREAYFRETHSKGASLDGSCLVC